MSSRFWRVEYVALCPLLKTCPSGMLLHVIGRVAKILLEHAGDGARPGQRLTQQEMAAIAGTAREVVGRSLKTLEERGIIKLERHRIVVTDKEALKQVIDAKY
jgi:CRP/FNR family transcriptional regulator